VKSKKQQVYWEKQKLEAEIRDLLPNDSEEGEWKEERRKQREKPAWGEEDDELDRE
jgi:hypothetical protein